MINYIIQVLLFQSLFLAVYDFFLHKETFFKWNRVYLLATPLLSFLIPLIKFERLQQSIPEEIIIQLPEIFLNPKVVLEQNISNETTFNYFQFIFILGIIFFTALFLIRFFKIIKLIYSNNVIDKVNYKLVIITKIKSAFSFFNYIFINKQLNEQTELNIIQHELIHCKQKHTLDLLLFEVLKILMWFNPLVYIYQKRITLLHEYISDSEIVKETDKKIYFNTLLAETFSVENITFINQFYKQSFIKKRIVMLTKNKSHKINQLKYLLIAPLLIGMLALSSFENSKTAGVISTDKNFEEPTSIVNPIIKQTDTLKASSFKTKKLVEPKLEDLPLKKNLKNISKKEALKRTDSVPPSLDIPFSEIDNVPIFPSCVGTEEELRICLQEKITNHVNKTFNTSLTKSLNLSTGVKRIYVMFKIDKEGNITDVIARAPHKTLQEEAIRVVNSLPKMSPGKQKGVAVGVKYTLPITFKVG